MFLYANSPEVPSRLLSGRPQVRRPEKRDRVFFVVFVMAASSSNTCAAAAATG